MSFGGRSLRVILAALAGLVVTPTTGHALEGPRDQVGHWSDVLDWGVQGKHMTLLNTGKVLVWSQGIQARIWDPETGVLTPNPAPFGDVHCAGQVTLADGRVMVVGGQNVDTHMGIPVTSIFDPRTNTWTRGADMSFARWYPTLTTMADGRALVTSGDASRTDVRVAIPEIYDPATDTWTKTAPRQQYLYPFMYQLANGKVFEAGTRASTAFFDPAGPGAWTPGPTAPFSTSAYSESGAMYGPGKILRAGGGEPARDQTAVIDMNAANPQWRLTAPMHHPRRRMNTPILLDGSVMAVGGTANGDALSTAVYSGEIWDPDTEQWREVASMSRSRMYHSTALTLPDGRVVVAGGEIGAQGPDEDAPNAGVQMDAQIYSPPYLFKGPRPVITSSPATSGYGRPLAITTDSTDIVKVALMRPSAVTHAIDMNQRYVPLSFTRAGTQLTATSPATAYEAPPGYYMLVVVDRRGVPSVAKWVLLGTGAPVQDPGPVKLQPAPAPTAPPVAGFTATTATTGTVPLTVQFANQSSGSIDSYSWDFDGDGRKDSGAANPQFTYRVPGTYAVTLTVRNAIGAHEVVKPGYVTVTDATTDAGPGALPEPSPDDAGAPAPGDDPPAAAQPGGEMAAPADVAAPAAPAAGGTSTPDRRTFTAIADATLTSARPAATAAADPALRLRQGSGPAARNEQAIVKFDVTGLGRAPAAATLRLFATDPSGDGGSVFPVSSAWTEPTVSWRTAPAITGASVASAGPTARRRWIELDVTRAVRGEGPVSFALRTTSADAAAYASRESAHPPQLVITSAAGDRPAAEFTAAPRRGTGPLTVAFADRSVGATAWAWDFQGDGTVDSTARSPRFTYTRPGTYSVRLTVTGPGGRDARTLTDAIQVDAPGASRLTRTFGATADTTVVSTRPRDSRGAARVLEVRQGDSASPRTARTYLRFRLRGLRGAPASAKLRLWVARAGSDGGSVHPVDGRWSEAGLTWSGAPGVTAPALAGAAATAAGTWVEWDVTRAVAGNGAASFALTSTSADAAAYASREDARHRPQLVVTEGRGGGAAQAALRRTHLASLLAPAPSLLCPLGHLD